MKQQDELNKEKDALKEQHKPLYEITIPMDEYDPTKTATIFLRKPKRNDRELLSKMIADNKAAAAIEVAIKKLYVGGDSIEEILKTNEDALAQVEGSVVEIFKVQEATLKKN